MSRSRCCEISKKLTWNPTLTAKNTPLFLFPYMGHSLQIFAWGMPLHAHVFSFTHNTVVLSHFRCVHPENQMKIFRFKHFYESKQTLLTQDLKWSLNKVVRYKKSLSLIYYFVLYYCFLHWAHLPNMAVGNLAFYYTLYLWSNHTYREVQTSDSIQNDEDVGICQLGEAVVHTD